VKVLRVILFTVIGAVVLIFALIGFLHSVRGSPVSRVSGYGGKDPAPEVNSPLFVQTIQLLTGTALSPGHEILITKNGDETYDRLWSDLRSAQQSITLQMYYCKPGRMADTLKEILLERAGAGVRVLFLHDAFGSQSLRGEYLDSLRVGGVEVSVFRPVKWYDLHQIQHRSHIRVVVVDGKLGWTGGFGIDDKWFGDGRSRDQWRDTNVRFTGPAVRQLQAIFATGWAEGTGNLITGPLFFPDDLSHGAALRLHAVGDDFDADAGGNEGSDSDAGTGAAATQRSENGIAVAGENMFAGVMHAAPTIGSTSAERLLALSIAGARQTLYITNSYFVPDQDFRDLLKRAAARGVDVRVLTADENSDVKTTWYAGRYFYQELLEAGVRIFEYKPAMMHAKSIVVDGIWSSVGTMNFDNRSMVFNDESNLNVYNAEFGARMIELFMEDLEFSEEITLERHAQRSAWNRVMEWKSGRLQRIL
jgi:cardiolipin synthase A/B